MENLVAVFASRKFILFALTIGMADLGWCYALVYRPDQLSTVSTFLVTLLGAYGGVNILESRNTAKYGATPAPSSWYSVSRGKPQLKDPPNEQPK